MANKLELTWYGKEKEISVEPRLLIERPELSNIDNDPDTENMLIHGDNLLALKALESKYSGQIKCIYIDPPYNINAANEHYSDFVENSKWLSLMAARLCCLQKLLSSEGVIFVQIDKEQCAYLKILMDEIFGRANYITTIAVRMSTTSGYKIEHSDKTIVKNTEYL
jgi:adenine-specific DNA-methyltransferase